MRRGLFSVVMVVLALTCLADAASAQSSWPSMRSRIHQSAQQVVLAGALHNRLVPQGTTYQQVVVRLPRSASALLPGASGPPMKMHPSVPYTIRSGNGRVLSQGNVAIGITRKGSAALYRYPTGR